MLLFCFSPTTTHSSFSFHSCFFVSVTIDAIKVAVLRTRPFAACRVARVKRGRERGGNGFGGSSGTRRGGGCGSRRRRARACVERRSRVRDINSDASPNSRWNWRERRFPGFPANQRAIRKKPRSTVCFRSGFRFLKKRVFRGREGDGFERQTETASETHRARVHATELKNRPSRLLPHRHPEPELVVLVGVVNLRGEGQGEPRVEALLEERGDHAVVVDAPAQAALP